MSMNRGKKSSQVLTAGNNKLYLDLKSIIREYALPFLPAKSLFRFKGVCKDWKLQIATPFFAHNQSISFRGFSGLFCQVPGNPRTFISIDPNSCGVPDPSLKFLPVPFDIRTSSNGILCCQARTGDKSYSICNTVTRQYKILPKPTAVHGPDPAIVLVFEPSLLNFEAEFKLVCAFPSEDFDGATEFEIYSSREGSWRVSGEICFAELELIPRTGVHVNGVVYWQGKTGGSILAFDLRKDRSQLIQSFLGLNSSLGVMDGKLCSAYPDGCGLVVLNVLSNVYSNTMQMSSNVRTWTRKCAISLDHEALGGIRYDQGAVLFAGDGMVVGQIGGVMYSYDLKKKETKVLSRALESGTGVVSYVNTLVYL